MLTEDCYDDAFRITGITDTVTPANSYTYGFDNLDRLTSAVKTGTTRGWTYDANGNRLSETGASPSTYTISSANNRVSSISGVVARTYTYDVAGNTLTYSNVTATYNNRGRMKTLKKASTTATFTYNALGELVKRTGGTPGTLHYVYDEAGHVLGEYNSTGALVQETIWLGDTPVATLRPGTPVGIFYVHTDHLNTPRKVTRPSDNKARWTWESDPFGTALPNENPQSLGNFKYNLRFPGQMYDAHTGLNYNYFRDYDAVTGRYVESDPIGLEGGVNTYAYAHGQPNMGIDPFGLQYQNANGGPCPLLTYPDFCEFVPNSDKVEQVRTDQQRHFEEGARTLEGELPGWDYNQDLPSPLSIRRRLLPNPGLQVAPTGDPMKTHAFRIRHSWGRSERKYELIQRGRCRCVDGCGNETWFNNAVKRTSVWRPDGNWEYWDGW